jgi:hypothetical protein
MNVVTQQETERWRLAELSAFRESAQDRTRSLQDSVRLLLDVRFVGLPARPARFVEALSRLLNIS